MRDHLAALGGEVANILDNSAASVNERAVAVYHTLLTTAVSFHFDARGATSDFIQAMPEILRRHGESVKADIITGLRNRRYQV